MRYQVCFVNLSSTFCDIPEASNLNDARNHIASSNGFLFLNISNQKPVHPSDEKGLKISDIHLNGFVLMQLETDVPWPKCVNCNKLTKEYPGKVGVSMAEVEFNHEILVCQVRFFTFKFFTFSL